MTFTAVLAAKAGEAISTRAVDDRVPSQEILNAVLASVSKSNA
jgi:hypothetical protein